MLAFFYLAAVSLGGVAMIPLLRLRFKPEGRLIVGIVLGQVGGVWLLYLLSSLTGRLSYLSIFLTASLFLLFFLASLLLPGIKFKKRALTYWKEFLSLKAFSMEFLVLLAFLALFFIWLNLHAILPADAEGNLYTTEHVWADMPFHVSLINSFIYRDNFPATYPILVNTPLGYPFLVDFHTAALIKGGLTLRQGIMVSNILLQAPLFLLIYLIARELGGSRRAGLLASFIFLFLGNFGFFLAFKDISSSGGLLSWLGNLPWGYTGSSLGVESRESAGVGLYLGNPTYLFFMPRRAVTFGVAASLTLILILLKLVQSRAKSYLPCNAPGFLPGEFETHPYISGRASYLPFIAAGLLLGLLPRIHTHSFLVMTLFTGFVLVTRPLWRYLPHQPGPAVLEKGGGGTISKGTERPQTFPVFDFYVKAALLVAVAALVAIPQLLSLREQVWNAFFKFWPGWIGEAHQALALLGKSGSNTERVALLPESAVVFLKFWIWNAGLLLLLLPVALWRATRNQLLFYCPFIFIFILGNLVKIQPWEWDNNNLFLYWQMGSVIIAALFLSRFLTSEKLRVKRLKSIINLTLLSLITIVLILGGIINIIRTGQEKIFLWSSTDVKLGQWVRENTPPDSLFLTSSAHNHPIPSLGGRQIVMGFEGWLFSHGLSYEKVRADEVRMFQGETSLLLEYGVDYVALTPYERYFAQGNGFNLNNSYFKNSGLFELVYTEYSPQGAWEIYRVRMTDDRKQNTVDSRMGISPVRTVNSRSS